MRVRLMEGLLRRAERMSCLAPAFHTNLPNVTGANGMESHEGFCSIYLECRNHVLTKRRLLIPVQIYMLTTYHVVEER